MYIYSWCKNVNNGILRIMCCAFYFVLCFHFAISRAHFHRIEHRSMPQHSIMKTTTCSYLLVVLLTQKCVYIYLWGNIWRQDYQNWYQSYICPFPNTWSSFGGIAEHLWHLIVNGKNMLEVKLNMFKAQSAYFNTAEICVHSVLFFLVLVLLDSRANVVTRGSVCPSSVLRRSIHLSGLSFVLS